MSEELRNIGINLKYKGNTYTLTIEAYNNSCIETVICTAESAIKSVLNVTGFTATQWGLELAPCWGRNYAHYVTVESLLEIAKYPRKLNLILI